MTSGGRYDDGKGDMEGIGSNAEDLPMYATCHNSWSGAISFTDALRYNLIRIFFDFLTLISIFWRDDILQYSFESRFSLS